MQLLLYPRSLQNPLGADARTFLNVLQEELAFARIELLQRIHVEDLLLGEADLASRLLRVVQFAVRCVNGVFLV